MTDQQTPQHMPRRRDIHAANYSSRLRLRVPSFSSRGRSRVLNNSSLPQVPNNWAKISLILGSTFLLGLSGHTYSNWADSADIPAVDISTGLLDLQIDDGCTWRRATPGYTSLYANYSEPAGDCDADALPDAVPGDVFEYRIPVTTNLVGDNLVAGFTISLSDQAKQLVTATNDNPAQLDIGYYIENCIPNVESGCDTSVIGTKIAPADDTICAADDVLAVPGLVGTGTTEQHWVVVIQVTVLGDYVWSDLVTESYDQWSIDSIDVALTQIRAGGN